MDIKYNPQLIEEEIYKFWEKHQCFKPSFTLDKESYCIMMPPPNITGNLHMGHAFQQTLIDILIRYQRMQGKNTLLQVGLDHAGIATQMIVERNIAMEEGKLRTDYTRDQFINKIWQWQKKSSENIFYQMRRLGYSISWERKRFTLDKVISNAVKEVFIKLYQDNLIYRGKKLVNWDSKLCSAISDLEVESRTLNGKIWYLRYPLANDVKTYNGLNYIVVATTRPETSIGDTAIAVNPEDQRYKNLIGKLIIVPLVNRLIPIISDNYVKKNKNTGCIKVTPAHDFNDYEISQRHKLPLINIFSINGKILEQAEVFDYLGRHIKYEDIPSYLHGLDYLAARKSLIKEFKKLFLLDKELTQKININFSERSNIVIEPMLTDQWYIRTNKLANLAIQAVKTKKIKFFPTKYENMYFSWMDNIHDWCISRQLWWGHRIPAWYDKNHTIYVGYNENEIRKKYHLNNDIYLIQDKDVLDTWFSSGLWTFASLGWPKKTKELQIFHPTNLIISGFDIIFFWIARMIMLTMYSIKNTNGEPQIPFKNVYITGLIRDELGQKMSKTKGNVIDPLDIVDGITLVELIKKRTCHITNTKQIEKICNMTKKQFPNGVKAYGTDALRFTFAAIASTSRNINWDIKRLEGYRNFCNKLWNASIFVLKYTQNQDCGFNDNKKIFSVIDDWIWIEFNKTVKIYKEFIENYRFDLVANILYDFTWTQFCDWYLEFTKSSIHVKTEDELRGNRFTLVKVLEGILLLAHPIIPFMTETIWQKIKIITVNYDNSIMLQSFPSYNENIKINKNIENIDFIKKIIIAIRNIRTEFKISLSKSLVLMIRTESSLIKSIVNTFKVFIINIAKLEKILIIDHNEQFSGSITKIVDNIELIIPITGMLDKTIELNRLSKEEKLVDKELLRIQNKLNNTQFIRYAPKDIIINENKKLFNYQQLKLKILKQKKFILNN